jgi:hypothetical protein
MPRPAAAAICCALALAGCGSPAWRDLGADPANDAPGAPRLALVPAAGGLDVAGSGGLEIGFGRDRAGVLAAVGRVTGAAARAAPCGGGLAAVRFDGLVLVFEGPRFVGWRDGAARAGRGCDDVPAA